MQLIDSLGQIEAAIYRTNEAIMMASESNAPEESKGKDNKDK